MMDVAGHRASETPPANAGVVDWNARTIEAND
jgi:hypothetical protein